MSIFDRFRKQKRNGGSVGLWLNDDGAICAPGYTSLDKCPEIMAGCSKIAELIASITIYLMSNTPDGDVRITNELSKKIDIFPEKNMTRSTWMHGIVMDMLLYGKGNAVVLPHTYKGMLQNLEPVAASRVSFIPRLNSYRDYRVQIDQKTYAPDNVLHFVYNPDKTYKWRGQGITVVLRDLAANLKQASVTEKAFMESNWKPSIIVKVDALTDEFSSPEGRQKLLESYVKPSTPGEPWLIPAEQFDVEQVRPLTLADLAIADTVELDKRTVASIIGVPPFILGVGEYHKAEYNAFIQSKIMSMVKGIMQEMTRKLIVSPSWYLTGNVWSLMDYDLESVSRVLLNGADRGYVSGDEWRDRMNMNPAGLKDFKILENYIPYDMSGMQGKLVGNKEAES